MYPNSKSWDLNFPGLSQFQILCPNFPHKPSKCLKNSTLSVSKHLPALLLHKAAAQTHFFFPDYRSQSLVQQSPAGPEGNKVRKKNPWQSALQLGCFPVHRCKCSLGKLHHDWDTTHKGTHAGRWDLPLPTYQVTGTQGGSMARGLLWGFNE